MLFPNVCLKKYIEYHDQRWYRNNKKEKVKVTVNSDIILLLNSAISMVFAAVNEHNWWKKSI